jgi:hypothetical protein
MISSRQRHKRSLAWFISGLVLTILVSLGMSHQQPATAHQPHLSTAYTVSEFAASHLEPNFYQ